MAEQQKGGFILHEQNTKLPTLIGKIPAFKLDFSIGSNDMIHHVLSLRQGAQIPEDLQAGIEGAARAFIKRAADNKIDLTKTREFSEAVDARGRLDPARVGAILFAVSLETDSEGKLRFDNHLASSHLGRINDDYSRIMTIADNVLAGKMDDKDSLQRMQQSIGQAKRQGADTNGWSAQGEENGEIVIKCPTYRNPDASAKNCGRD